MKHSASIFSCPIAQFEKNYDEHARKGRFITEPNAHLRALRMLRMVAEAAHDLGKKGMDINAIEVVTEMNPATCESEMHVVIRPKWKLRQPVIITHVMDGLSPYKNEPEKA